MSDNNVQELLNQTNQQATDLQNIINGLPARPSRLKLVGELAPVLSHLRAVQKHLEQENGVDVDSTREEVMVNGDKTLSII